MTIDDAIDRNVEVKGELIRDGRLEKAEAVQLSIEALKEIKELRGVNDPAVALCLKGETKD